MSIQLIITLCILVFLVVMLLTNKLPYGVSAMICCVLFVLFGILDLQTAFSGLSSSTTLMIAPMIVVASALGKTSLIGRIRKLMDRLQGKSGFLLVLGICGITIILSQLMGQIACISVMLLFLQTLDDKSEYSPARMLFLVSPHLRSRLVWAPPCPVPSIPIIRDLWDRKIFWALRTSLRPASCP